MADSRQQRAYDPLGQRFGALRTPQPQNVVIVAAPPANGSAQWLLDHRGANANAGYYIGSTVVQQAGVAELVTPQKRHARVLAADQVLNQIAQMRYHHGASYQYRRAEAQQQSRAQAEAAADTLGRSADARQHKAMSHLKRSRGSGGRLAVVGIGVGIGAAAGFVFAGPVLAALAVYGLVDGSLLARRMGMAFWHAARGIVSREAAERARIDAGSKRTAKILAAQDKTLEKAITREVARYQKRLQKGDLAADGTLPTIAGATLAAAAEAKFGELAAAVYQQNKGLLDHIAGQSTIVDPNGNSRPAQTGDAMRLGEMLALRGKAGNFKNLQQLRSTGKIVLPDGSTMVLPPTTSAVGAKVYNTLQTLDSYTPSQYAGMSRAATIDNGMKAIGNQIDGAVQNLNASAETFVTSRLNRINAFLGQVFGGKPTVPMVPTPPVAPFSPAPVVAPVVATPVIPAPPVAPFSPAPSFAPPVIPAPPVAPVVATPVIPAPPVAPVVATPSLVHPFGRPVAQPVAPPVVQRPVVQRPVVQQPVAPPVVQRPVVQRPVAPPVVQRPVVQQPVVQRPVTRTPVPPVSAPTAASVPAQASVPPPRTVSRPAGRAPVPALAPPAQAAPVGPTPARVSTAARLSPTAGRASVPAPTPAQTASTPALPAAPAPTPSNWSWFGTNGGQPATASSPSTPTAPSERSHGGGRHTPEAVAGRTGSAEGRDRQGAESSTAPDRTTAAPSPAENGAAAPTYRARHSADTLGL